MGLRASLSQSLSKGMRFLLELVVLQDTYRIRLPNILLGILVGGLIIIDQLRQHSILSVAHSETSGRLHP